MDDSVETTLSFKEVMSSDSYLIVDLSKLSSSSCLSKRH